MKSFNVLLFDFNKDTPAIYDIMPYLCTCYKNLSKSKRLKLSTFDDYKKFIIQELKYQYWGRCEYEFLMVHWPYKNGNPLEKSYKIDIYEQCKMNIDIITQIFIDNISINKK